MTDSNGQPITKAVPTYNMRFRIYNTNATDCQTDTGGLNDIWEEIWNGANKVQVTNGLFSAVLGTITSFTTQDFNSDYWLQVTVDSNDDATFQATEVFTPCDRLTTAPYAVRAIDANSASSATNANACSADNVCDVVDILAATGGQIDFFDETGDKVYWWSNTYGTGIEASTLTDWSASQFRWRVGGTSVSTGTEEMLLSGPGLNLSQNNFVSVGDTTNKTYFSSGGAFTHLAFNAYYNGTAWVGNNATLPYALYQQSAGAHNWYYAPAAASPAWGAAKMTLDTAGNLTVTGTISGGAINASDCSADVLCTVQQIDSGQGATEVYLMNQNVRTTDNVSFGAVTAGGEVLAPAFRAPSAGYGSGAAVDVGDTAVDYPGNAGWAATWNSNILLSGLNSSSISFHDSALRVDTLRVAGGTFYLGENVGWGVANLNVGGAISNSSTITTPGYISITGVSDASGNLRFSAANPYISASSYFVAPGGAYFSNAANPVYSESNIRARGGISNDSASTSGYLYLNDDVLVANWLRLDGNEGLYFESWGGGWNMIDSTYIRAYGSKPVRADSGFYVGTNGISMQVTISTTYNAGVWTYCPTNYHPVICSEGDGWVRYYNNECGTSPGVGGPSGGYMICVWHG